MDYSYLKQKKILLVDDEEEILTMVTGFLREDGYTQIRTASTVADALSVWRQWEPELAVLDVMLPDGRRARCCFSPRGGRMRIEFAAWAWAPTTIW